MRSKVFFAFCFGLVLLLVGCKHDPSKLPGTWAGTLPNGLPAEITYTAEGGLDLEMANPGAPTMKIGVTGKYHEEGDQLYMTFEDVKFTNVPEVIKAEEGKLKDDMKKTLEVGTEKVTTITWDGDKAFTTKTSDGKTSSFTKKG